MMSFLDLPDNLLQCIFPAARYIVAIRVCKKMRSLLMTFNAAGALIREPTVHSFMHDCERRLMDFQSLSANITTFDFGIRAYNGTQSGWLFPLAQLSAMIKLSTRLHTLRLHQWDLRVQNICVCSDNDENVYDSIVTMMGNGLTTHERVQHTFVGALAGCTSLRRLELHGCNLNFSPDNGFEPLGDALNALPGLEELSITNESCRIESLLWEMRLNENMRALTFAGMRMEILCVSMLEVQLHKRFGSMLHTLVLSNCNISAPQILSGIMACSSLKYLDLSGNLKSRWGVLNSIVKHVSPTIETLRLMDHYVETYWQDDTFCVYGQCAKLRSLDLGHCCVSARTFSNLFCFLTPALVTLSVHVENGYNTDALAGHITTTLTNLQCVDFGQTVNLSFENWGDVIRAARGNCPRLRILRTPTDCRFCFQCIACDGFVYNPRDGPLVCQCMKGPCDIVCACKPGFYADT
jgi:hypothetical protein